MKGIQLEQIQENIREMLYNFTSTDDIKKFRVSTNNKDTYVIKNTEYTSEGKKRYRKFSIYELKHIKDYYGINEKVFELSFQISNDHDITMSKYKLYIMTTNWYRYDNMDCIIKDITSNEDVVFDNDLIMNTQSLIDSIVRANVVQKEADEFKIATDLINYFNPNQGNKKQEQNTNNNDKPEKFKWRSLFKRDRK